VFVQALHVGVGGRVVKVEVIILDVLAVIAFVAVETEEALLEDRVVAVPQRNGEAEKLVAVADARDPVLVPAVGAGAGVINGEVFPRSAIGAVVFAYRPPRPVPEKRSPPVPVRLA